MNIIFRRIFAIGLILFAPGLLAAIPQTINYQGYITSPTGTPLNTDPDLVCGRFLHEQTQVFAGEIETLQLAQMGRVDYFYF